MKSYTAIYSTPTIKGIHYEFQAENMAAARRFRKWKFSAKRVKIVPTDLLPMLENRVKDKL